MTRGRESTAPPLGAGDVAEAVQRYFGARRDHFLIAFHGTGGEDVVRAPGGPVRVVPIACELDLRRRLLEVDDAARVAFLVPWRGDLPLDLRGRFAQQGRIEPIGRDIRLQILFRATEMEDGVARTAAAAYLLEHHAAGEPIDMAGGRLTSTALWCGFLERAYGFDPRGELALDALLGFAAASGHGPARAAELLARGGAEVRAELDGELARRLGPAGPLVFKAWELGRGAEALELALLFEAGNLDDPRIETFGRMAGRAVFGGPVERAAQQALGAAAAGALRVVARRSDEGRARAIIRAADQRAADDGIAAEVSRSTRLRSSWTGRLTALSRALEAVAAAPGAATARGAIEAHRGLAGHDAFTDPSERVTLERAAMATRLAVWLGLGGTRDLAPAASTIGEVERLAAWYVATGAFVDWARRGARGSESGALGPGIAAVLGAVDAERLALDRRFAAGLPEWIAARRPSERVLPIDQLTRRIVARFVDEHEERRMLLLLLDGMAWPQAAELLTALGAEPSPWGPLAWHGMAKHRLGEAPFPPVLAAFPTITEVSRSALFAGTGMAAGKDHPSAKDPDRWRDNPSVRQFAPASEGPQLLLRAESHDRQGSASQPALRLIADTRHRVVALVVNAIDEALKGDPGVRQTWNVDAIKSLREVLEAARDAGRAVLLCADHGNVPADCLETAGGASKGSARWRPYRDGDTTADYEVVLRHGDGVWSPRGCDGVVLLADDAHVYSGARHAGEHGGASLAEVVAPCVLIGCEDGGPVAPDPGREVRPFVAPAWWTFDLFDARTATAPAPEPAIDTRPGRRTRKPSDQQLSLIPVSPPSTPPPPEPTAPRSRRVASELLTARAGKDLALVVQALELLIERNGICAAAPFAAAMNVQAMRVGGVISRLEEIVNVDGYPILRFDRQSKQIHLEVGQLALQFGLTL